MSSNHVFILPVTLAFIVTLAAVISLRGAAPRLGLLDHPGGRKHHHRSTPVVGGLAMAIGICVAWLVAPVARPPDLPWLLGFGFFVLLGAVDDVLHLRAGSKFLFQAFVAAVVVVLSELELHSLGEILPGWSPLLGWLAVPFSVFAIVSVMNALNMSDGVDGLAGSLAVSSLLSLSLASSLGNRSDLALFSLVPLAALAAFLVFNMRGKGGRPALVFMGDAGSLGIGFLLAVLSLKVASTGPDGIPPVVVLWSFFVPLADGLSVILSRLARRADTTSPGRDHLHHLLLVRGRRAGQVVLLEAGAGLFLALAAIAGWRVGVPDWVLASAFAGAFIVFHLSVLRAWAVLAADPRRLPAGLPSSLEPEAAAERGGL